MQHNFLKQGLYEQNYNEGLFSHILEDVAKEIVIIYYLFIRNIEIEKDLNKPEIVDTIRIVKSWLVVYDKKVSKIFINSVLNLLKTSKEFVEGLLVDIIERLPELLKNNRDEVKLFIKSFDCEDPLKIAAIEIVNELLEGDKPIEEDLEICIIIICIIIGYLDHSEIVHKAVKDSFLKSSRITRFCEKIIKHCSR